MPFGNRLKEARLNKGLTQEELAKIIGVSKGAIGNYESEVSSPKEPILIKLMHALDVDANFLFQDLVGGDPGILQEDDRRILVAYHAADPAIQAAVLKLLDLPDAKESVSVRSAM